MQIKLKPFQTPNFAIQEVPPTTRQEGFTAAPSWPLSDVDAPTLAQMCDEFRAEVFRKAGKDDPSPLLRFRDAMTPEMWKAFQAGLVSVRVNMPLHSGLLQRANETASAMHAALDTLRQALQQGRQR